jgi:DNA-binding response OmpR family regulator
MAITQGEALRKRRMLVVDDDPAIRDVLRMLFEEEGYEVEEAPDGASGINTALAGDHDVYLVDNLMPNTSPAGGIKDMSIAIATRGLRGGLLGMTAQERMLRPGLREELVARLGTGRVEIVGKPFDMDHIVGVAGALATQAMAQPSQAADNPDLAAH